MKKYHLTKTSLIPAALALLTLILQSTSASAQSPWPTGSQWIEVSRATYNGGQERVLMPFTVEVETTNFALVVPQYCAPRSLASRAQIIPDYGYPGYTRWVDLRFRTQEIWAGQIRAYYTVDTRNAGLAPLVTALAFSFVPVQNRPGMSCPIRIFTHQ
jgi:hypothetical protein